MLENVLISRRALPAEFRLNINGVLISGWRSSYSLGVFGGTTIFHSVMLLNGYVLAHSFDSLAQAHEFNKLVLAAKVFVGTPTLEEFYARAGGVEVARAKVDKLARRVKKI